MARSQETFSKREKEKKRLQKRKEKEQRKEERKAEAREGKSFEDMLAYVDENGNISSTPPDPMKKRQVKQAEIEIGSRNKGGVQSPAENKGRVTFYNATKGFGFIKDSNRTENLFFHSSTVHFAIQENDVVTYDVQPGPKGLTAVNVKKSS